MKRSRFRFGSLSGWKDIGLGFQEVTMNECL